jgi:hypothetical protein
VDKHGQISQMSDIYAAAQLTIVVAAGKDSSYGLPGVIPGPRHPKVRCETIDTVHLVVMPPPGPIDVANSTWHSRAWTFQEGFSSRRRLFFTDRQVLYVCNSGMQCEAADPFGLSRGPLEDCLPPYDVEDHGYSAMDLVKQHIRAYSGRELSFESDALNAIKSSLGTFARRKEPVYHIWGVPFKYQSLQPDSSFDIALNFYHEIPCHRRPGFPSWSMLGWKGPIQWCDSPYRLTKKDLRLSMRLSDYENATVPSNESLVSLPRTQMVDMPSCVQVTVYGGPVSLVHIAPPRSESLNAGFRHSSTKTAYIAFPYIDNTDVLLKTYWDTIPSGTQPLARIALQDRNYGGVIGRGDSLLVLEADGLKYQRVGLCVYEESWKLADLLFRDRKSGKIDRLINLRSGQRIMDQLLLDLDSAWQRMSTEQTFTIG